jgi:hypothetical protein
MFLERPCGDSTIGVSAFIFHGTIRILRLPGVTGCSLFDIVQTQMDWKQLQDYRYVNERDYTKTKFLFRQLRIADIAEIAKTFDQSRYSDRDFLTHILHHQLLEPRISRAEFRQLPEATINNFAIQFLKGDANAFARFNDTGNFDEDVLNALTALSEERQSPQKCDMRAKIEDLPKLFAAYLNLPLSLPVLMGRATLVERGLEAALMPNFDFFKNYEDRLGEIADGVRAAFEQLQELLHIGDKESARLLQKYKWFICPSMPVTAYNPILELARKKGRQDRHVTKLFIDYFSSNAWANLIRMVDGWSGIVPFNKRMPIFRSCIKTLQMADREKFNGANVVLPALIGQIEGLWNDYLHIKQFPHVSSYKTRKAQFRTHTSQQISNHHLKLGQDLALDVLFQNSRPGHPLSNPFYFNRHKILHGESLNYGRNNYVVRAFMILDFIASLDWPSVTSHKSL